MYTFNQTLVQERFSDLHSQMVKQAVRQARADNSKAIYVSQHWFNVVKSTLKALVHPAPLPDTKAVIHPLDVTFIVREGLGDYEFEVK